MTLALVALTLGALTLWRRESARPLAITAMLFKFLASAYAPYVALAGAVAVLLGILSNSIFAIAAGFAGFALAANHVRRTTAPHDGLEMAFGADRLARATRPGSRPMLHKRWYWRLPSSLTPRVARDLAFWLIPGTDRALLCDIWQPPQGVEPSGTAIVYLHGSAWYILDKDVLTRPLFRYLAGQGHTVMDVAYRLCPETNIVGMVGDARRAVAWMKANASRYGCDPARIVLMGASAGGHVALLAALGPGDARLTPAELSKTDLSLAAIVSFYGVADMREYDAHARKLLADRKEMPASPQSQEEPGPIANALMRWFLGRTLTARQSPPLPPHEQMMRDLLGGGLEEVPHMYDLASPIHHVRGGLPPALLFHGDHDSLVPAVSARRLFKALRTADVPAVHVEYPGVEHGFDLIYPPLQSPAAQSALYDLERFLGCLSPPKG
ncbi:MAG: alpha/beta hydrolase [Alphaproteobacteria bacterium]|nr:alpha/beta hydrolase [Alphaproteobacteria bacterium]